MTITTLYSTLQTQKQSHSIDLSQYLQSPHYNMLLEKPYRSQIKVKFHFPNEPSSKIAETLVNPFAPLLNYKGIIESDTRLDLYGRRIQFKYKHNEESYKIEYLQDIAVKTKMPLKNDIDVQIFIDEMGG